ncbi:MAG: hypothetical protein VKN60_07750 [Cyanobacteriota bacterium]|nr:hypothetical protein [Cyanobacteriota bacterium]
MVVLVGLVSFNSPAIGAPAPKDQMSKFCQGEAASQYGTKPIYIKTEKPKQTKDGSYTVNGTADLGNQGTKPFQCHFSKSGEFKHFMSLVDEGAL